MRLVLKPASPWIDTAPDDGEALAFAREDLRARLYTTSLRDRFAWPAVAGEIAAESEAHSTLGWPVRIVERLVAGVRELEVRYELFELGGAAVVRGPADEIARHRDELLAVALAGWPDWGGEIACVADLLAGVIERP